MNKMERPMTPPTNTTSNQYPTLPTSNACDEKTCCQCHTASNSTKSTTKLSQLQLSHHATNENGCGHDDGAAFKSIVVEHVADNARAGLFCQSCKLLAGVAFERVQFRVGNVIERLWNVLSVHVRPKHGVQHIRSEHDSQRRRSLYQARPRIRRHKNAVKTNSGVTQTWKMGHFTNRTVVNASMILRIRTRMRQYLRLGSKSLYSFWKRRRTK